MPRGSNPQKIKEWKNRLAEFAQSNQSIAVFCVHEGVSEASFYHWRKKLRAASDAVRIGSRLEAVHVVASPPMTAGGETTIELGNDIHIQLGGDLRVVELVVKQLFAATIAASCSASRPGAKSC